MSFQLKLVQNLTSLVLTAIRMGKLLKTRLEKTEA